MGAFGHVHKQLAGVDEVALGLDGIVTNVGGNHCIVQGSVVHAVVPALNVVGKVLADEAIEQSAQHVLLEVPSIDGTPYFVGNGPNAALQFCALLLASHIVVVGFLESAGMAKSRLAHDCL